MRTILLWTICLAAILRAQEPKTAAEWQDAAMKQHKAGNFREAAESWQKALDAGAPRVVRYNLACALARLGEADRAMSILNMMAENGAIMPLATDEDLAGLRGRADFQALVVKSRANAEPCKNPTRHPEYRAFDFWIGDWDVFDPAGKKVGDSRIELILKDCTILENWSGLDGSTGKSYNAYSPALKKWQQFWTATSGNTIYFIGDVAAGEMRFIAEGKTNGLPYDRRMTFTKLPEGKVRQHSERNTGDSWVTEYDLTYAPKKH